MPEDLTDQAELVTPGIPQEQAVCSKCEKWKSFSAFNHDSRSISGRRSECRACQRQYNREFQARKPPYNIWNLMIQRCYNPRHPGFRHYGERGIEVCVRWHRYESFAADMTPRP